MQNRVRTFHITQSPGLRYLENKYRDPSGLRQAMGLPNLQDTDKNCIKMHNSVIENETVYFSKHMGSSESKKGSTSTKERINPCLGSKYGF